jgi:hypothetical protein
MKKTIAIIIGIMFCLSTQMCTRVKTESNEMVLTIQGKQYKIPETEEAWDSIMKKLYDQPFKQELLNDWNNLEPLTDGCAAECATDYIATLYMEHPQAVLTWIARQPKEKDNIWVIVFGEGKGIVGFPTKERVAKDVNNIEDVKDRKTLLKLLENFDTCE